VEIADDTVITLSDEHTEYVWADEKEVREKLGHKYPDQFIDTLLQK
jgi:hypothetical protein